MKIYVASKTKHAPLWIKLRSQGYDIISTWIDEAGEDQSASLSDLWQRCINEASSCHVMIVYAEPGDELKGALIEIGAALSSGIPVWVIGEIPQLKTAQYHPLMKKFNSLKEALIHLHLSHIGYSTQQGVNVNRSP